MEIAGRQAETQQWYKDLSEMIREKGLFNADEGAMQGSCVEYFAALTGDKGAKDREFVRTTAPAALERELHHDPKGIPYVDLNDETGDRVVWMSCYDAVRGFVAKRTQLEYMLTDDSESDSESYDDAPDSDECRA